ncbi:MAG: response regulator [Desulfobacterales bacterium]|nr:response regulator [Desulfobacterales bacterium]
MKGKTIALVIEDEDSIIQVVSKKLRSLGHKYKIAKNQEEANNIIVEQQYSFDYILLDLKLPVDREDIDPDSSVGFNLLQQIRGKYSQEKLPIIIMTAYERNISSAVEAMKNGANDFVEKPFESNELEKKIIGVLNCKHHKVVLCLQELPANRAFKNYYAEIVIYHGKKDEKINSCRLGSVMLRFFYLTLQARLQGEEWVNSNTLRKELNYDNSSDLYWLSKRINYICQWLKKNGLTQYFNFYESQIKTDIKIKTTLSKDQIELKITDFEKAKSETKA